MKQLSIPLIVQNDGNIPPNKPTQAILQPAYMLPCNHIEYCTIVMNTH